MLEREQKTTERARCAALICSPTAASGTHMVAAMETKAPNHVRS